MPTAKPDGPDLDKLDRCSAETLLLRNKHTGQYLFGLCNHRHMCRRCAKIYQSKIWARARGAQWQTFITLTMPPDQANITAQNIGLQSRIWERFRRRLLRRLGTVRYFAIREGNRPEQRLHLHLLLDVAITHSQRSSLLTLATSAGFGEVADLRSIAQSTHVLNYVTKDLNRIDSDPGVPWPPHTKLFFTNLPQGPSRKAPPGTWVPVYNPYRRSTSLS
jgi:hypothetical protein